MRCLKALGDRISASDLEPPEHRNPDPVQAVLKPVALARTPRKLLQRPRQRRDHSCSLIAKRKGGIRPKMQKNAAYIAKRSLHQPTERTSQYSLKQAMWGSDAACH